MSIVREELQQKVIEDSSKKLLVALSSVLRRVKSDLDNPHKVYSSKPAGMDEALYTEVKQSFGYLNQSAKYIQERNNQISKADDVEFSENLGILKKIHKELDSLTSLGYIDLSDTYLNTALINYIKSRLQSEQQLSIDLLSLHNDKFLADFINFLAEQFEGQINEIKSKHPLTDAEYLGQERDKVTIERYDLNELYRKIREQFAQICHLQAEIASLNGIMEGQERKVQDAKSAREDVEKNSVALRQIFNRTEQELIFEREQVFVAEYKLKQSLKQLEVLQDANVRLQAQLAEIKATRESLDNREGKLSSEQAAKIDTLAAENKKLSSEIESLRESTKLKISHVLEDAKQKTAELNAQNKALSDKISQAESAKGELESKIAALETRLGSATEDKESINAELETVKTELAENNRVLDNLKTEHTGVISGLQEQLRVLEEKHKEERDNYFAKINQLKDAKAKLVAEISGGESIRRDLGEQLTKKEAEKSELAISTERLMQAMREQLAKRDEVISGLKADVAGQDANIERINTEFSKRISGLEQELKKSRGELSEKESEVVALKSSVQSVTEKNSGLEEELASKNTILVNVQAKLENSEKQNAELRQQIVGLQNSQRAELERRDVELKEKQEELSKLNAESSANSQQIDDLQSQLFDAIAESAVLIAHSDSLERELSESQVLISVLRKSIADLETRLAQVAVEKEDLSKQIALQARLALLKPKTIDAQTGMESSARIDVDSQTDAVTPALVAEAKEAHQDELTPPPRSPSVANSDIGSIIERISRRPILRSKGIHDAVFSARLNARGDIGSTSKHQWGEKFQTLDREPEDFYFNGERVRVERKDSYRHPESLALETLLTVYLSAKAKGIESPFVSANPNGDSKLVSLFYAFAEVLKESGLDISYEVPANVNISSAKNEIYNYFGIDSANINQAQLAGDKIRRLYLFGEADRVEISNYIREKLDWENTDDILGSGTAASSESQGSSKIPGLYNIAHSPSGESIPDVLKERGAGISFDTELQQALVNLFIKVSSADDFDELNSYRTIAASRVRVQ